MNIGIFSGSFNPVHIGHLALAGYITEFSAIDEVWFMVSPQNPLKKNTELLDENCRLEMARIAVSGFTKLKTSDFEFSLSRPSYTVHTFEQLRKKFPEHTFSLIIGADNWELFENWYKYDEIIRNHSIYIYPRLNHKVKIKDKYKNRAFLLNSPVIEISSTFIRNNIKNGKDMRAFLPEGVYDYIIRNNVYK